MANVHNMNLFFYIKGSKDYPNGLKISDKFGFEDATQEALFNKTTGFLSVNPENAIFENSIRDLFVKNKGLLEVTNIYSLFGDEYNKILTSRWPGSNDTDATQMTTRTDRTMEYISTWLIRPAQSSDTEQDDKDNNSYKYIFPNYNYESLDSILSVSSPNIDGGGKYEYSPRSTIFWQKMFSLFEFLKKEEANIVDNSITGDYPQLYSDNVANGWWSDSVKTALDKESSLGQFIGLFIGSGNFAPANEAANLNRFRLTYTTGTDTLPTGINRTQESLWKKITAGGDVSAGINIEYVEGSASFQRSVHTGRIASMSFSIKYLPYESVEIDDNKDLWNFTVYFDPDSFMESASTSQFAVWTYNDTDLDEQYPDYNETGFNIYDNDYANMLRSESDPKRGHFVATDEEINASMAEKMLEIMQGTDFTGFYTFETTRVSPEIVENGTVGSKVNYEVSWHENESPRTNVTKQKFYVFYNTTPPTPEQAKIAVQNYILELHSHCHEQTYYSASDSKVGVKYIGHPTNRTELINWLSKMYPDMFSETVVYIVPPSINHRKNQLTDEFLWNPEGYFNTVTPQRIYESMRTIYDFRNFELSTNGSVTIPTTTGTGIDRKQFPTEVFHLGGLSDQLNNGTFKFGFPWIACTNNTDISLNPLTSQTGFADYVPKFFTEDVQPSSPADEFQLVMLYLTMRMFVNNDLKKKLTSINGVTIAYEQDPSTDNSITSKKTYNVAKFIINAVTFKVYAQIGKSFGSIDSEEESI